MVTESMLEITVQASDYADENLRQKTQVLFPGSLLVEGLD